MNRGYFHDPAADPDQYIFGSASPIVAQPLQPDRNWQPWCPPAEIQNKNGYDPLSCASYGSLNVIEIFLRRVFDVDVNYSDRWIAFKTGTNEKGGNDPHFVLESIRKDFGSILEELWPFGPDVTTFEKYYSPPPAALDGTGRAFIDQWTLKHDTVRQGSYPSLQDAIWDALQYSPLGSSVGFNFVDGDGYWYKNGDHPDFHWVAIVGGEYGKYFLIFDSAESVFKKAAWARFNPQLVKRISITRAAEPIPLNQRLYEVLKPLIGPLQWLSDHARELFAPQPQIPAIPDPLPPEPKPDPTPTETASQRLYNAAFAMLGKDASPRDAANDEVGCVDSLQEVISRAGRPYIANRTLSTAVLANALLNDPAYKQIDGPELGAVTVFPTSPNAVGHCGIVGKKWVMSNNSASGLWEANYTLSGWEAAAKKRGLPVFYFRPL